MVIFKTCAFYTSSKKMVTLHQIRLFKVCALCVTSSLVVSDSLMLNSIPTLANQQPQIATSLTSILQESQLSHIQSA